MNSLRRKRITSELRSIVRSIWHNRFTVLYATIFFVAPFNITKRLHFLADSAHPYIHGIYSNYLYPTVSVLDIMMLGVMILAVAEDRGSLKDLFQKHKYLRVLVLYLLIHIAIFHNITTTIWSLRFFTYMTSTLLLNTWLLENRIHTKTILRTIILSGIIQVIVGIAQVHKGHSIGLQYIGESMVRVGGFKSSSRLILDNLHLRAYGTFPHPNLLAGYTVFAMAVLTALTMYTRNNTVTPTVLRKVPLRRLGQWPEFYVLPIIGILALCILLALTVSYSGILTSLSAIILLSAVAILLSYGSSKKKARRGWPVAGFLLLGTLLFFLQRPTASYTSVIRTQLHSEHVVLRLEYMRVAFRILREHPWVGIGAGNFVRIYQHIQAPLTAHGVSGIQPVHNIYLLIAAEHGIFVATIATIFVAWLAVGLIRDKNYPYAAIYISFFSIIGNLDHYLLTLPQGIFITSWLISYAIALRADHVREEVDR